MNLEQLQIVLFDLYDVRNALSSATKAREKSDGSDETIGEALNDAIAFLEQLEEVTGFKCECDNLTIDLDGGLSAINEQGEIA